MHPRQRVLSWVAGKHLASWLRGVYEWLYETEVDAFGQCCREDYQDDPQGAAMEGSTSIRRPNRRAKQKPTKEIQHDSTKTLLSSFFSSFLNFSEKLEVASQTSQPMSASQIFSGDLMMLPSDLVLIQAWPSTSVSIKRAQQQETSRRSRDSSNSIR